MKASTFLKKSLKLIENPANWCKGTLYQYDHTTNKDQYCSVGCMWEISRKVDSQGYVRAHDFLKEAKGSEESIASFNDDNDRAHSEIVDLFLNAIALAKAAGE